MFSRSVALLVCSATAIAGASATCAVTSAAAATASHVHAARSSGSVRAIVANDNRTPAGTLSVGVLTVALRAAVGEWRPEGEDGPALRVAAFGEAASPLMVPGPLLRVPEGTIVHATVRNELDTALRVHGLCERGSAACAPLDVPAGEAREARFASGPAGTYHYWATTTGMPLNFRAADDTQLSGAFIVDAADAPAASDRVLVITEWTSLTREQLQDIAARVDPGRHFLALRPDVLFAMNGRVWPHTERLTYRMGEAVRWRVINLSTQVHPMHLHGFYFDVDSLGDGERERTFSGAARRRVVTQVMASGATMSMTWVPERVGNWLFHCHVMLHVSPVLHVDGSPKGNAGGHEGHASNFGMTGMVMGITVTGPDQEPAVTSVDRSRPPRQMTLVMAAEPGRFGDAPAFGFVLGEAPGHDGDGRVQAPGPRLVLTRGEPVQITLVNRLPEATAIHWHGMELESYYDGVHGWSGIGTRVTPMIEPGTSFVVRFTPPRAGTFIYHTHLHDNRQLTSGLYGAMLVLEPGEVFDEKTDHVVVMGRGGPDPDAPTVLNGERAPVFVWTAGARHRLRLINITPNDIFAVSMQTMEGPIAWRALTKDGQPVEDGCAEPGPAKQTIAVGETYDFEIEAPPRRGAFWLEVRTPGGRWEAQGRVIVR